MTEDRVHRRLAAILAADMVGYSRLMGVDEVGTVARQKAHRAELIDPRIAAHNGRIVKTTGDGLLVEFASAVDAVDCAVAVQRAVAAREAEVPEDRRIAYRIGVNVGDIIIDGDDILGDGVNIAARMEALAEPGGVCIAGPVFTQVRNKVDLGFADLGPQQVKNIAEPVPTYRVLLNAADAGTVHAVPRGKRRLALALGAAVLVAAVAAGAAWWQPWTAPGDARQAGRTTAPATKPSIAVLPFANLSGDKSQEYFSDGLTADLTTDLSRISGLTVIARTSAFAYKGRSADVRTIGKELGTRYLIEGSVHKIGGRVRINAQLVDARTGNQIWADRFDRDAAELFKLQDELRAKIVWALRIKLTGREEKWLNARITSSQEAYDYYLRGLQQESYFTKDGNARSRRFYHRAIELDPDFAAAYARLAGAYSLAGEFGWTDARKEFAVKALALAKKAVALDGDLPLAHWSLARIYANPPLRDYDRAIAGLEKALSLDPNYADAYAFLAYSLTAVGKAEEALGKIEKAMRINPRFPYWYLLILGRAQFCLTRFDAAAKTFKKAIARNPTVPWPHYYLLATYGHLNLRDESEWEISELKSLNQQVTIAYLRERAVVADPTYLKLYLDGLRKAGVPEE